jgi:cellulose 1,4-beta-cellobiosidase
VASGLSSGAYTDAGLASHTTYYFAVSGLDAAGQSAPSAERSATTAASTPQPPAAPSNLSAVAASSTAIHLTWSASSSAGATYNVYRNTSAGATVANSIRIATGLTATSYASSGLTAATVYYYLVTAANGNGESAPANVASATTQTGAQSGSSCHVVYTLNSLWNVGFNVGITIQNAGAAAINGWTLGWNWPANESIQQAWNSNLVSGGPNVVLTNASWNGSIAPGATLTGVGFNGTYTGTYVAPTTFYLNGSACQ